ncbi:MAG: hypothetical protein A4E35_01163 [Methanoregula sp. PtaU1.Bin051]|nr:MAG: hypothetical protein A4E35_01163 [Methanoregula sp. PtaU1.Bin051]
MKKKTPDTPLNITIPLRLTRMVYGFSHIILGVKIRPQNRNSMSEYLQNGEDTTICSLSPVHGTITG